MKLSFGMGLYLNRHSRQRQITKRSILDVAAVLDPPLLDLFFLSRLHLAKMIFHQQYTAEYF